MSGERTQDATMEAGRELDAAIAERVMGWVRELGSFAGTFRWNADAVMLVPSEHRSDGLRHPTSEPVTYRENVPHFSTEMSAAWEVVERMGAGEDGYDFELSRENGVWSCWFLHAVRDSLRADAGAAPLAVCRAALLTVMNVVPLAPGDPS